MPKVFIANFGGHNYQAAQDFGELHYITKGFLSYQSLDRLLYAVADGLKDTDKEDYLALSGTNIINVTAAVLWFERHGQVKLLNFDKNTGKYRELVVNSDSIRFLFEVVNDGRDALDITERN